MKKLLAVVLAVLMLGGVFAVGASASPVDITAKFTDAIFKEAVYGYIGKTAPAPIYDTDVAGVKVLHLNSILEPEKIKTLAGLEYFTGLQELNCANNELTSLPALPPGLTKIYCAANQLTSLPILPSGLETLWCFGNKLTSLPALPLTLNDLDCSNNQLISLPVLTPALKFLSCSYNKLISLPALPSTLEALNCANNQLANIDVTGLSLTRLDCRENYLPNKAAVKGFTGTWDGKNFIFDPQNSTPSPQLPPTPSFIANVWNFILRYLFFGFLWMK